MKLSVLLALTLQACDAQSSSHSPQGHAAARSNDIATLREIYSGNTNLVNIPEPGSGQTPLMAAVLSGATKSVETLLLELNADPTIPEKDGYTPPHGAGFQGRADVATLLIQRHQTKQDCPIDAPHSGDHVTPLWRTTWGTAQRHVDTGLVMVEGGADPNYRVPDEMSERAGVAATPLQSAVVRSNIRSVQMLCAHGGNANIRNRNGATSLHLSLGLLKVGDRSQEMIIQYLLEQCNANPNLKDNNNKSSYRLGIVDDEGLLPDFLKDSLTSRARLMPSDPSDLAEREEEKEEEEEEQDNRDQKKKKKKKKKTSKKTIDKQDEEMDTVEL